MSQDRNHLPTYAKSLLKIRVPTVVTLAKSKRAVRDILELGPGSIIAFDKTCEELLDLEIGGHLVARGEAVKVGENFGLKINAMVMPPERFHSAKVEGREPGAEEPTMKKDDSTEKAEAPSEKTPEPVE